MLGADRAQAPSLRATLLRLPALAACHGPPITCPQVLAQKQIMLTLLPCGMPPIVLQVLAQKQNMLNILSRTTGHSVEKLDRVSEGCLFFSYGSAVWGAVEIPCLAGLCALHGQREGLLQRLYFPHYVAARPACARPRLCRTCSGRCTCSQRMRWSMASSMASSPQRSRCAFFMLRSISFV